VLGPFIADIGPTLPHRTLVHLHELRDDIETFTDMSPDDSHANEKVELYLEHYPTLNELHQEFEERWADFSDHWNTRVASVLDDEIASFHTVEEGIVAIDTGRTDADGTWFLQAKKKDWQPIYREGWFKPADEEQWESGDLDPLREKSSEYDTFRILYNHRMKRHRDVAIEDGILNVTFRNARANPKPFHDIFSDAFDAREAEISTLLPQGAEMLGQKSDQFRVRFDIPDPDPEDESAPDDFFDAYTETVGDAFRELVLENPELTEILTEIYTESIDEHMKRV
jgi:hypothetical protein